MKYILLLIFIPILLFAQAEYPMFDAEIQFSNSGYIETDNIALLNYDYPQYNGQLTLSLTVDSLVNNSFIDGSTPDSLLFFPEFKFGNTWVVGDTIEWSVPAADTAWSETKKYILPRNDTGKLFLWQTDPTSTYLQSYTYYDFRVKIVFNDSVNCSVKLNAAWY